MLKLYMVLSFGAITVAAAPPSQSKISIHLLNAYSPGAAQIIQAHPRVIKILGTDGGMMQAARDFKASTPQGKVVCRIFTPRRWQVTENPAAAATNFWETVLAPPLNLSAADKALIDYVEGPNEGDSTPTWASAADTQWYNTFWMHLAPLIANAGFRPLAYSISVGNPPGSPAEIQASLDRIAPSLRLCQSLGGGWSYHSYSLPYSTSLTDEIWYSVRYRQYYSYFASRHPDLVTLPLVLTEGGIDGAGPWSTRGDTNMFQNWLSWFDSEIRRDSYCLGVTLFQIGNTTDWAGFNVEPVAGWIAGHLLRNSGSTNPPRLAMALLTSPTNVAVTLTEPANSASAGNPGNYYLRRADTGIRAPVLVAPVSNGTNILLRTAPLAPFTDYLLTVSNVGAIGVSGATPGSNGTTNVLAVLKIASMDETTRWRYQDSGANPGTTWRNTNFNDATWPAGPALLGFDDAVLPEPLRTQVAFQSSKIAYYFRSRFHWPYPTSNGVFRLRQIIDDGVVLYLNGREIHRTGMTNNPVYHTNFAARTVPDAAYEGPFTIAVSNLVDGTNTLAAEVHQPSTGSGDIVFGISLEAIVAPSELAGAQPVLNLRPMAMEGLYQLTWTNSAFALQWAAEPRGPWTRLSAQSNPYVFSATNSPRFFRLSQ